MIFYFSGTGNTRWAAETLAKATGEKLLSIADELHGACHYELGEGERLGFCFPIHGWWPPQLVRQFVQEGTFVTRPDTYIFALVTYGDSAGRALPMFKRDLSSKGLSLHACFGLQMPESYVCLPFMYTDKLAREQQKLSRADNELRGFISHISSRQSGHTFIRRGYAPWIYTNVFGRWFNSHMVTDRQFRVDAERCISCGLCEKVCPTGDVALNDLKLPQWQHDGSCTCCLACYHHCPQHAINYGTITRRRGQYYYGHH